MHPVKIVLSVAAGAAAAAGCQNGVKTIDSSLQLRSIEDAEALLFETHRRYIVLELVESPVEDIVDDNTVVGFFSLPWYAGSGVRYEGTRVGFGWLGGSLLLSEMFTDKEARTIGIALPETRIRDGDSEAEFQQVLELSRDRETSHEPAALREISLGSELRIVGQAGPGEADPTVTPAPEFPEASRD